MAATASPSGPRDLLVLMDGTGQSPEASMLRITSRTNVQVLRDELGGTSVLPPNYQEGWEVHELINCQNPGLLFYDRGLGSPRLDSKGKLKSWSMVPASFFENLPAVYKRFGVDDPGPTLGALGIIDNVAQAYRFLVQNYNSGDRVFLFGFSRGAYTLRLLIQLIRYLGLIKKEKFASDPRLIEKAFLLYDANIHPDENVGVKNFRQANCISGKDLVYFLGLWDTVRGPVLEEVHDDPRLNTVVQRARHALSIDDLRQMFKPSIWTVNEKLKDRDYKQMWFAGVHSDIGGGYPETERGLANIALNWMIKESNLGTTLDFDKMYKPDPLAMQHDSYWVPLHEVPDITWADVAHKLFYKRLDNVPTDPDRLSFHPSVSQRAGKHVKYETTDIVYKDYPTLYKTRFPDGTAVSTTTEPRGVTNVAAGPEDQPPTRVRELGASVPILTSMPTTVPISTSMPTTTMRDGLPVAASQPENKRLRTMGDGQDGQPK